MYKYILMLYLAVPLCSAAQVDSIEGKVLTSKFSIVSVEGGDSLFLRQMYNVDTLVEEVYIKGGRSLGSTKVIIWMAVVSG